ncbi:M56 family metallopeptidase [Pedobacter faecalis]|uniref:M56 family metallopeptidase n=1 Tax=Pedobacter faecalis TaxID=3041495 RepID=UPI00254F2368|nr:M56 family metallopeptidase [Pedobacter sp. ELA7]
MNWVYYLLEANVYLAIFYGFYRLILARETFYTLSRFFLLASVAAAFILPLLQVSYLRALSEPLDQQTFVLQTPELTNVVVQNQEGLDWSLILFVAYGLVSIFFLSRLARSVFQIISIYRRARWHDHNGVRYLGSPQSGLAFSFFGLLFMDPNADQKDVIIGHELTHIKQGHSLDIMLLELVHALNWFNPVTWTMRRNIKLIHEYIADEATIGGSVTKHYYAMFLIQNSIQSGVGQLANQVFNQSILKPRIMMLNKKKSAGRIRFRLLFLLPLIGIMPCVSTLGFTKDYAFVDLYAKKHPPFLSVTPQEPKQGKPQEPKMEKRNRFIIESRYNPQTGNNSPIKLIVINGKVSKAENIRSVEGYDRLVQLNGSEATAKYGKRAAKGALEFEGKNTRLSVTFPPPAQIKKPGVPPTPPLVKKQYKRKAVKFPPPSIKSMSQYDEKTKDEMELGPNPIYVNNGEVVTIPAGKKFRFEAQSVSIHPKNTDKLIEFYGEQARDGVIELKKGKIIME